MSKHTMNLSYQPTEVISTEKLAHEDWLDFRRQGIGGSDVAAIMGLSPFCTTRDLYYDKCNIKPVILEEQNWVAKEVGHLLEDLVAKIFSEKLGLRVYQVKTMFSHPLYPFMRADVDYFVDMPDGSTAILECKTTNYNCKDHWKDNAVPVNYELQGRHYMAVMNINTVFYACLYGNNENEFIVRRVDRDLDYEQDIIEQEEYFWNEFVKAGVEPSYTEKPDLVMESIRRHYGYADTTAPDMTIDQSFATNLKEYFETKEKKSEVDKESKRLEAILKTSYGPIIDEMGVRCKSTVKKGNILYEIQYKPVYKTTMPKENLAKLETHHPDIYEKYVTTTESRRFSVKQKEVS